MAAFASRIPPARGKGTDPATLVRWARDGCRAPDGSRVRLMATRVGGRWMLTEVAWAEFLAALTGRHVAAGTGGTAAGGEDACVIPQAVGAGG